MTRSFIDSGVLIAAAVGKPDVSLAALAVLDDPGRRFVSSDIVRLEVLPKALYFRHEVEAAFYNTYFRAVADWAPVTPTLVDRAHEAAQNFGLSAIDALHVAAAEAAQCDELITGEKPGKPLHRVMTLRVVSIYTP